MKTRKPTPNEQAYLRQQMKQARTLATALFWILAALTLGPLWLGALALQHSSFPSSLDMEDLIVGALLLSVVVVWGMLLRFMWRKSRLRAFPNGRVIRITEMYTIHQRGTGKSRRSLTYIGAHFCVFPPKWQRELEIGDIVTADLYAIPRDSVDDIFTPAASTSYVLSLDKRSIDQEVGWGLLEKRSNFAPIAAFLVLVLYVVGSVGAMGEHGIHPTAALFRVVEHGFSPVVLESFSASDTPAIHREVRLENVALICDEEGAVAAVALPPDARARLEDLQARLAPRWHAIDRLSKTSALVRSRKETWDPLTALEDNPAFADARRAALGVTPDQALQEMTPYPTLKSGRLDPLMRDLYEAEPSLQEAQITAALRDLSGSGAILLNTGCPYGQAPLGFSFWFNGATRTAGGRLASLIKQVMTPRTVQGIVEQRSEPCAAERCAFALNREVTYNRLSILVFNSLLLLLAALTFSSVKAYRHNRAVSARMSAAEDRALEG